MPVFRVEKNSNYTTMCNYHLRDQGLSLKGKGLLSMLLSLPDTWNYSVRGLSSITLDGVDGVLTALKELERLGYLERNQQRESNGRMGRAEYVIYEMPRKKPCSESPCTEKPYTVNPDAHGKYLNVTDSAKESSMFSEDALKLFLDLMQGGLSSESEKESSTALTPEGNMTLVDDIGEEEDKSSQQFITLVTKAGNTFYLIIDRDKDGNQNVHFLNMVDEADLLALMDEEEAAKYQERKPEVTEPAETEKPQETEPATEEQKTENEQKKSSPLPMIMLLLFVIGAAGVGGYLYIKMKGVKPASKKNQPDPDADYHDEDEEALQLPEDAGDEDEEVDVNEDYEAESDDEPV